MLNWLRPLLDRKAWQAEQASLRHYAVYGMMRRQYADKILDAHKLIKDRQAILDKLSTKRTPRELEPMLQHELGRKFDPELAVSDYEIFSQEVESLEQRIQSLEKNMADLTQDQFDWFLAGTEFIQTIWLTFGPKGGNDGVETQP